MMDSASMRTHYEWHRIQNYKGAAGTYSGRACGCSLSFGEEGCEQYRTWCSESKSVNHRNHAIIIRSAQKAIQRITKLIDVVSKKRSCSQRTKIMKRRREYIASIKLDLNSLTIKFFPVYEFNENSQKRKSEAIQILANVILLASRRGRSNGISDEVLDEAA